jgi:hypothetical protein
VFGLRSLNVNRIVPEEPGVPVSVTICPFNGSNTTESLAALTSNRSTVEKCRFYAAGISVSYTTLPSATTGICVGKDATTESSKGTACSMSDAGDNGVALATEGAQGTDTTADVFFNARCAAYMRQAYLPP